MGNFDHMNINGSGFFDFDSPDYDKEKNLVSVIINEAYNKFGVCMDYYITSYDIKYDRIFGEDNNRRYIRSFPVNVFYKLPNEEKTWSKFGIEGTDDITLWISKQHFEYSSIDTKTGISYVRPQIGDIIRSQYNNYYYEITEVSEDTGMFFQSKQYIWELNIRPMKDEFISVTDETETAGISDVTNLNDIFDIGTDTDIEIDKDKTKYTPDTGEKPQEDPFGNW